MSNNESRESGFIGRQQELAVLTAALDEALAGRGQLVMLAGEPGIGKTRTAQELAALADAKGAKVLVGWCYEHGGAPAYWPWLQCIRAYVETADPGKLHQEMGPGAADISEILPELAAKLHGLERPPALEPEQARFRLMFSITNFLKGVSQSQPLVLVLDDLQWADESSLLLLEFLTREIPASSLMIVGAYRDGELTGRHPLSQTLGNLVRERHFHRVQLEGLSRKEVGEFVEAKSGVAVSDAAVNTLHQRTGGNPLFVGEVVGSVSAEEMALDQEWIATIPEAVRDAILRRLSGLSEACNRLLRTASIIGREFDLTLLQYPGSGIADEEIPLSLNEALGIRIIEPLGPGTGRYQFGHALIQQAVYEEIPPIEKAQVHAAMGEALEQRHQGNLDEHARELSYQFFGAQTVLGTDKLVHYSLIAGERALETFAYDQAMAHFSQVLAAKEGLAVDSDIAAALFGLGRAQITTLPRNELGEAHSNLGQAFDYYASVGDTARVVAITFEFHAPQLTEHGIRTGKMVERALELVPANSLEAGRLHAYHGNLQGLAEGNYQGARESLDRALTIANQIGNAPLQTRTLVLSAQVEIWNNHFEDSLKFSLPAIDLAIPASDLRGEVAARYWAALGSHFCGDPQGIQHQGPAILESAKRLRDRNWLVSAHDSVGRPLTLRGDWHAAREIVRPGLDQMPLDPRILLQQVVIEAQTGDRDQVEIHLDRMEEAVKRSASGSNTPNGLFAYVAPLARHILGAVKRPNLGESSIDAVLSSPSVIPFFSTFARIGASLLAVMDDDIEAACTQYAALQSSGMTFSFTHIDRVLGLLAGTMGNQDDAVAHFEKAHTFCARAGYLPELAWTCHDHAATLLMLGGPEDREKAATLLEECLSIATELRMTPLMVKAATLQGTLGADPGKSPAYPSGLTQREVEVLTHLSQGKTNREIARELVLSERTVQRHISNIYTKINVRNRTKPTTFALGQLPS